MDEDTFQGFVFKALLWGIAYYFIRKGLNPANKDLEKFKYDAIYGSIAAFFSGVAFWFIKQYVIPRI